MIVGKNSCLSCTDSENIASNNPASEDCCYLEEITVADYDFISQFYLVVLDLAV